MIEGKEILTSRGAVAAGPEEAARVGARVLDLGGNAMDAAAATSMACCMLQPQSTGVMGYVLCALVLDGRTGKVWSLDANSIAPASARETMYDVVPMRDGSEGDQRERVPLFREGQRQCARPAGGGPARDDGGDGDVVGALGPVEVVGDRGAVADAAGERIPVRLHCRRGSAPGEPVIRRFPETEKHLMPEGRLPKADDRWHRRDMEKSLTRACEAGWRDFYDGEIGRKIADHVGSGGGALTREDMAAFMPRVTAPYETTYRDATVYAAILPNGGLTALQVLNMLECFDPVPDDTVTYWHRLAEVLKLAWRDRLLYLADPDHVEVRVERLLSKDYAAGRAESVRQFPQLVDRRSPGPEGDSSEGTLHVSTADVEGNVASVTISQGGAFGSLVTVPGTGLILGHGMCRLDPRPGRRNSVGPGKRPLNNTAPLIIRLPDRDVATGLPGGRKLVSVNARVAQKIVDFGATSFEAVSGPRMHVQMEEPLMVTRSLDEAIRDGLLGMGHDLDVVGGVAGGAHCAEFLKLEGKVRAGGNTWAAGV